MKFKFLNIILLIVLMIFILVCSSNNKEWETAKKENTIEAYSRFWEQNRESPLADSALVRIEKIVFKYAVLRNTLSLYEKFLSMFPNGSFADSAQYRIGRIYLESARASQSIPSYKKLLEKYVTGTIADAARLELENLYKQRKSEFRSIRNIKIIVSQDYGKAKDASVSFKSYAAKILEYSGLNVINENEDKQDYDAVLRIKARGEAKSSRYSKIGAYNTSGGRHYSGASLSGSVSIEIPGKVSLRKFYKGYVSPPEIIGREYPTASSAPFDKAYHKSKFELKLFELMGDIFSTNTIISALDYRTNAWGYTICPAEELLVNIGSPVVEDLINYLENRELEGRDNAAMALGRIKDSRGIKPLVNALRDKKVWSRAAYALEEYGWKAANEKERAFYLIASAENHGYINIKTGKFDLIPVVNLLMDTTIHLLHRKRAAKMLGKSGDTCAVMPLIKILNEKRKSLRSEAIQALGNIKDRRAVMPLTQLLKDEYNSIRRDAISALSRLKWEPKDSTEIAILYINNRAWDECVKLGNIAIEPLITALNDGDSFIRVGATKSLRLITGQDLYEDHDKWLDWWNQNKKTYLKSR